MRTSWNIARALCAILLCLAPVWVAGEPPPAPETRPKPFVLTDLLGTWKSTTKPGQSISISTFFDNPNAGASVVVHLSGTLRWEGSFDPETGTFNFERVLLPADLNSEIPDWARDILKDDIEAHLDLKERPTTLHLQLHALRCPREDIAMLSGEWFPGEAEWKETLDANGKPASREARPTGSRGQRQMVCYTRTGESPGECDDLRKMIEERSAAYDRVDKLKTELDSKLRRVEGELGMSSDRYKTVKKYMDDYDAAVAKAKTVEDIAGLLTPAGLKLYKKLFEARNLARAAEIARGAERAAQLASDTEKAKAVLKAREAARVEKLAREAAGAVQTAEELAKEAAKAQAAMDAWEAAVKNKPRLQELKRLAEESLAQGKALQVSPEMAMALKADPQAMRSLKNAPKAVREAFNAAEGAVNEAHDRALLKAVSQIKGKPWSDPANPVPLVVNDFRTPGASAGSINTDRDFRVLYRVSENQWREVPRELWKDESTRIFADVSGYSHQNLDELFPPSLYPDKWSKMNPEQLEHAKLDKWSELHQQLATDQYHLEASSDFSDQQIRNGTWSQKRPFYEDPENPSLFGYANTMNVKQGLGTLEDPQRMGMMYKIKMGAYYDLKSLAHPEGDKIEALCQGKKALEMLDDMRIGYQAKGMDVGNLPDQLLAARKAIKDLEPFDGSVTNENLAKVEQQLQDIFGKAAGTGTSLVSKNQNPVAALADMIDAQFNALKAAEKASDNPVVKAGIAARETNLSDWLGLTGDPQLMSRLGAAGALDWMGNPYTHLLLMGADLAKILPQDLLDSELKEMASQADKARKDLVEAEGIWNRLSDAFDRAPAPDDLYEKLKECLKNIPEEKRGCFELLWKDQIRLLEERYRPLNEFVTHLRDLRKNFNRKAMYQELHRNAHMADLAGPEFDKAKAEREAALQAWKNSRPRSASESGKPLGDWPEQDRFLAADEAYNRILSQIESFSRMTRMLPESLKFTDLAAVLDPATSATNEAKTGLDQAQQNFDAFFKAHPERHPEEADSPTTLQTLPYQQGEAFKTMLEMVELGGRLRNARTAYNASLSEAAGVGQLALLCSTLQGMVHGLRTGGPVNARP